MNGTWSGRGDHLQDGDRHHLLCPERAVAPGGPDGDPAAASCVLPNPWQSCFAWVCCCHPHHDSMVPLQGVLASPKSHQTRPQKQPPLLGNLPVLRQRGQGSICSCPQHPPTPLSPPYHGVGQGVPGEEGLTHGGWQRWVRGSRAVHGAVLSGRPAVLCPPRVTAWTFSCARTLSPPPDLPVWGIH